MTSSRAIRNGIVGAVALAVVGLLVWATDRITLEGERTLFTVRCEGGEWRGLHCSGRLNPAEQYGFRASRYRQEVLYWVRFSSQPSRKHARCQVTNRDNWKCEPDADGAHAAVYELVRGKPVFSAAANHLHGLVKWKWYALDLGLHRFSDADY